MPTGRASRTRKAFRLVELTQHVARGDKNCLAELYDLTSPCVYGAALQLLRSSRLATVVTEEVYVDVWRSAPRYNPSESSVLAWMMGLTHRRSTDKVEALAARSASEWYADVDGNGHHVASPSDGGSRPDVERARRALSTLTDPYRQAFVLAYFGECSQGEVARILGLPLGKVTTRIRNGLVGLRNELAVGT